MCTTIFFLLYLVCYVTFLLNSTVRECYDKKGWESVAWAFWVGVVAVLAGNIWLSMISLVTLFVLLDNDELKEKFVPKLLIFLVCTCIFLGPFGGAIRREWEYYKSKPVLIENVMVVNDKFLVNNGQFVLDLDDNLIIQTGDTVRLVAKGDSIKYCEGSFWKAYPDRLSFVTPDGVYHEKY